jgi:3-methyladenine DNA glycosylase AlkD
MASGINTKAGLKEVLSLVGSISTVIPAHRKAFKEGYSFSKQTFEEQLPLWDHIWKHSNNFRAQLHAYFFLEQYVKKTELHQAIWKTSLSWQKEVNDWGLCDALAKINTKVLETHPEEVYSKLAQWNKDKNLWERRQSVVSLLYYSRTKKIFLPFKKIVALVEPLLTDKEYYVQKGVGWTLREMHTVYPSDTLFFFKKNIKTIHPIAFTIAIEKMSQREKDALKLMRR